MGSKHKRSLFTVFCAGVLLLFCQEFARGAGVTIITHGFNGNVTDWIIPMANRIPQYNLFPGSEFSCYEVTVGSDYSVTPSRIAGVSPIVSDSGEIVIKLDWSSLSVTFGNSTSDIADAVVPKLLSTTFVPELAGRSLTEFPIHLVGHSRGGSVVSEMARLLGQQGVWVDHVTTLDPHPVSFPYGDADVLLFENVLYADNYWQTNPDVSCPNGESILGAYNRFLGNLENGYSCNHSDVHLWYHGTIDWFDTPATDTQATITSSERQTWWTNDEGQGAYAGFYYTLIGGGDRLSSDEPAGSGTEMIRDGYNKVWDFGAGSAANRYALSLNNGAWPNVIRFNITGTNRITAGELTLLKLFYQYGATANQSVNLKLFLDRDFNPYNGNDQLMIDLDYPSTGTNSVFFADLTLSSTNVLAGIYAAYAKMSGGGHTRYLYAPEVLMIDPNLEPPRFNQSLSMMQPDGRFQLSLSGAIGQKVIIQGSTNLTSWIPISTNSFSTTNLVMVDIEAPSYKARFYRAMLAQ